MFSSHSGESINIKPVVPAKRPVADSVVQTEPQINAASSCQAPERMSKHVQADVSEKPVASSVEFDPDSLLEFLNRVTPQICGFLQSNIESDPFCRYKLLPDTDTTSTYILHSLKNKTQDDKVFCTDASWNSIGTAVAVSLSEDHRDWCEHDSFVSIWNLQRKDFSREKPNTMLEIDGCITKVAFHPSIPALLAGAKFSGHVFVCNIVNESELMMASADSALQTHREPITGLVWNPENKNELISCSLDGKILVWTYKAKKNQLELKDGFIVLAENLSRSLGIKSVRPDAEVGVTSISINSEDPSIFIIGTEGGGIFQCSFHSMRTTPFLGNFAIPLKSPMTVPFEKHSAHVSNIHFSPFLRNVFLSSSIDGEIRIYTMLQKKPVLTIHMTVGVVCAQWSPVRPLVIAAVTSDGQLHIFDLIISKTNSHASFPLSENSCMGTSVCFCKDNPSLLCTTSSDGAVQVWMLSDHFTAAEGFELEYLKTFTTTE